MRTYPDYLFWFRFAQGSFTPAVMVDMVAGLLGGGYAMVEARLGEAE